MPNWPISALASASFSALSAASRSRKARGAGAGDGAERVDEVLAAHADAVVGEGQRLVLGVDGDGDGERPAALDQFGLGDRFVAQLLAGVGGVGDEFANENVAVRIDRMHHQVQQPRNVGFETLGFRRRRAPGGGCRRHVASVVKGPSVLPAKSGRAAIRAARADIAAKARGFQDGGKRRVEAKKSGPAGRGPADPLACVAIFRSDLALGGWGAKTPNASVEPNHRGSE